MKSATELLEAYLTMSEHQGVRGSVAEDGVLELPWVKAHAQGPIAVEQLLTNLLAKIPDFRFKTPTYSSKPPTRWRRNTKSRLWSSIPASSTSRRTAACYSPQTARSSYSVRTLDTLAASKAFSKTEPCRIANPGCVCRCAFRRTRLFAQSTPYPTVTDQRLQHPEGRRLADVPADIHGSGFSPLTQITPQQRREAVARLVAQLRIRSRPNETTPIVNRAGCSSPHPQ